MTNRMSLISTLLLQQSKRELHPSSSVQDLLLDLVLADIRMGDALVYAPPGVEVVDGYAVDSRHPVDAVFDLFLVVRDERLVHEEQLVAVLVQVDCDAASHRVDEHDAWPA